MKACLPRELTYLDELAELCKMAYGPRDQTRLWRELIARVPMGPTLLGSANPVRTGGSMQVSIDFAEAHASRHRYPYAMTGSVRDEVFTRRGGLYFGIAHLLQYPSSYTRHIYRYADFNAGWYASRNAAFQSALAKLSGIDWSNR